MSGLVSLVGAGPGNAEWLTVLGHRRLSAADVIIYDRLVDPALLSPYTADKINVGQLPYRHKISQAEINELMVNLAKKGQRVVRLKAGDPNVFGRGGEEAQYLKAQHVAFEVVPGLTSAIAGLAAAGIPITSDQATSFHVITGHRRANGQPLDWANIAHQEGTLVFVMGMENLETLTTQLIINGMPRATPAAVVQWATQWRQRAIASDLGHLVNVVQRGKLAAPALIVVGQVVNFMGKLTPKPPLQGLHLLVPYKAGSKLFSALQDEGASVNCFDRRIKNPLPVQLPDLTTGGTLVITDFAAMPFFLQQLHAKGLDIRALSNWKLLAMNHVVKYRLQALGLMADGLYDPQRLDSRRPIVLIGEQERLTTYHVPVKATYLPTYESVAVDQPLNLKEFHGVVFPSSQSVADLYLSCGDFMRAELRHMPCFAMGQVVADECQKLGLRHVILVNPSYDSVIQTVKKTLRPVDDGAQTQLS